MSGGSGSGGGGTLIGGVLPRSTCKYDVWNMECGYNIVNIIPSHTKFNCRVIREDVG